MKSETNNRIGVVSSSNPEMDRLAGELCRQGSLEVFVRRYVNKNRPWEKLLCGLPNVKQRLNSTFGRRPLPPGLTSDKVVDAGVFYDFLYAVSTRARMGALGGRAQWQILQARNAAIARAGSRRLRNSNVVIGNYGVSAGAFRAVKARGGRTILNYPNAHHRYSWRLLCEEMEREPEFAPTITNETAERARTFDRECELADTILVGSEFVKRTFAKEGLGDKDIFVAPYGSDTAVFAPAPKEQHDGVFRTIFAGQLTQRKGISYLLRAYETFRGPGTELTMAGKFVASPEVFQPYREFVLFPGNLPHAALAERYQRADVFVFPTLLEGMGLVVLEAMASSLPVITTDQCPGDLVRDGIDGFIVPMRDPEAIASKLECLRANPELRVQMGHAARERALEFTWKRYCDRVCAMLERYVLFAEGKSCA